MGGHTILVTPGKDHPENSEWHDDKGRALMMPVKFIDGVANVDSQLGKYLIDKGLAKKSPIITELT